MNFLRPRFIGLAMGFVIALLFAWWLRREVMEPTSTAAVAASVHEPATVAPPVIRHIPEEPEPITDDERAERNVARPEAGSGETQVEHLLRSVLMANAEELKLTPAQVDQLANTYLEFQEIHAELVSQFLNEISFDPASVTLHLPAHPVEGKLLRDMFYRRIEAEFPNGKAAEIEGQLSGFFDNAFRGFGVTEQTFTLTRDADVPDAFEVRWTANLPEGQLTGAVNPEVGFAGSSGSALLYREQVATGEFRFLGSVLERRFPNTPARPVQ
ncbi:MAG TPA: hypothetical protein VL069_01020 [Opitutus sp.]|nr:hypothetical protein [Opitutus sp.]